MGLTKEQIEDMRTSLALGAQPFTKEAIDSLCSLAMRGLIAPEARRAEVRLNGDEIDEIVTKDGDHLERMDYNHWFLQIADVAVWLYAKGTIAASFEYRREPQGER